MEIANGDLKGRRFLIAEDNEINAEILAELLQLEGAVSETAVNGKEALNMLLASQPGYYDMVLMDIQMPVMDGYEATRAIREAEKAGRERIPVVAMTASVFPGDVQKAFEAGMDAHIAKPVDMELLKETIQKLLDK